MCSFCDEPGSPDRLLVGDEDTIICEACVTLAVAGMRLPRRGEGRWAVSTARQVIRQVVAGMRLPKVFYFEEVTQRLQFIV